MGAITKTEQAVTLWKSGKIKEALRIFKTFKIGFSKDDKQTIEVAYEMMSGNEKFYVSLGFNRVEVETNAKNIIEKVYQIG